MTAIPGPDQPADRLAALQAIYDAAITGATRGRVRFRGADGSEREVEYTAPDIPRLERALAAARATLAASSGRPARHAITAGAPRSGRCLET